MNNEQPKKPHLRIEHIKDGFGNKKENKSETPSSEEIDFSKPQEVTPEFLKKIQLSDPEREQTKNKLIEMLNNAQTDEERMRIEHALRQLLLS